MSTLWTPGGERPVGRDQGKVDQPGGTTAQGGDAVLSEEEARARLDELRDELARTPPETVVANHAVGLFELARLHLSIDPQQLPQARLAIDAYAALVEGLGSRLGAAAPALADGLAQLRLAFVEAQRRSAAPDADGGSSAKA